MSGSDGSDDEAEENWSETLVDSKVSYLLQRGESAPNTSTDSHCGHPRAIIHIDMDCFYAQVEMIRNPSLRDKPLGIQQKSIIVTCNYVARDHGLKKLMYLKEAQEKCPEMVVVNGEDLTNYREMSYRVTEILTTYSPHVERLGFDENYIDVTHLLNSERWKHLGKETNLPGFIYNNEFGVSKGGGHCCEEGLRRAAHIAAHMRQCLYSELGVTCCAGIAHNKLLAKLVGETHKPNQQTVLPPSAADALLLALPGCRKIPGVGSSMVKRLGALGVNSVSELRSVAMSTLEEEFGHKTAQMMRDLSVGIDESKVTATGRPQTMSDEDSFKKCDSLEDARKRMKELLDSLFKRLKEDGRVPQTVRLTVRKISPTWHRESRQGPIPGSVTSRLRQGDYTGAGPLLLEVCVGLFQKLVPLNESFHLTLINIAFTKLQQVSSGKKSISSFFVSTANTQHGPAEDPTNTQIWARNEFHKATAVESRHTHHWEAASGASPDDLSLERVPDSQCFQVGQIWGKACSQSADMSVRLNQERPPSDSRIHQGSYDSTAARDNAGSSLALLQSTRRNGMSSEVKSAGVYATTPLKLTAKPLRKRLGEPSTQGLHSSKKVRTCGTLLDANVETVCREKQLQTFPSDLGPPEDVSPLTNEPSISIVAPPGVDAGVFSALPLEIKKDVLAQIRASPTSCSVAVKTSQQLTHRGSAIRNQGPSGEKSKGKSTVQGKSVNKQGIIGFLSTPTPHAGDEPPSSHISSAAGSRDDAVVSCGGSGNHVTKALSGESDRNSALVPPDVDRVVFLSLPEGIQQELLSDWRRRSAVASQSKTHQSGSILKYLRKN